MCAVRALHVLFVCTLNEMRSPTAQAVFAGYPGIEARSAGIAVDARCPVTDEAIEWADQIFAMEELHARVLRDVFGWLLHGKRLVVLHIRDEYPYMDPELIEILRLRVPPYLEAALP